jgi:hypothetical protein
MAFYVRMTTRGAKVTDTPRLALRYITREEVTLQGCGELAGELDEARLADLFERSCQPSHDPRASLGYKSITLTLPKEVSLYADSHRKEALAAMAAALPNTLDSTFPGFRYWAVAAIHTRSRSHEVHYYAHVLVGKFAQKVDTGKTFSLNSASSGNSGYARLKALKSAWQEGIEKEFRERLNLGIEQPTPHGPVALVLPDGSRIEPLPKRSPQP